MLGAGVILENRYRIDRLVGQGGMGAVYQAWDNRLNRYVAIKEMIPDPSLMPHVLAQFRQQFRQEAMVLAQLNHVNMVRASDFFDSGSTLYWVMDFVNGETLHQRIQRLGKCSIHDVVLWANQLLSALSYCHQAGIIHRDIKPQNIIIRPDGQAVLVDFGLAKYWVANAPTQTAIRGMGTPEYSPPEQYYGYPNRTDPRSDLYSLGATLYHALSGQPPPIVTNRISNPNLQPLRAFIPAMPPYIDAAICKAMELQPTARFYNAEAMRIAITNPPAPIYAQQPKAQAASPNPRLGYPAPVFSQSTVHKVNKPLVIGLSVLTGMCLMMTTIGAGLFLLRPPILDAPTSAVSNATAAPPTRMTNGSGSVGVGTAAPISVTPSSSNVSTSLNDISQMIAYITKSNYKDELWLWNPSSKASTKLAESVRSYLWSPDGKYIAYAADNNLIIRNITDVSKTTKIEQTKGDFAWSPDSTQLAYLQDCKVYVINVSGTSTRLIYDINGHGIGGKGGGGGGDEARDYIQEAIDNFSDFKDEIGFLWSKDGTRIALVSPAFGCDLSGVIIQADGKWLSKCDVLNECHKMLGKSTTDIYLRQQDNLRILLKDEPGSLYRYKYDGINLSVDAKSPDLADRRLMTDMARRANLTNWGFHNNLWGSNSDGSPRRITNTPSFKFQGMISADRAWILFVDIQIKNGVLREGRDFIGDLVSNLWAVRISDNKLVQITTSGDAKLGAWQLALQ